MGRKEELLSYFLDMQSANSFMNARQFDDASLTIMGTSDKSGNGSKACLDKRITDAISAGFAGYTEADAQNDYDLLCSCLPTDCRESGELDDVRQFLAGRYKLLSNADGGYALNPDDYYSALFSRIVEFPVNGFKNVLHYVYDDRHGFGRWLAGLFKNKHCTAYGTLKDALAEYLNGYSFFLLEPVFSESLYMAYVSASSRSYCIFSEAFPNLEKQMDGFLAAKQALDIGNLDEKDAHDFVTIFCHEPAHIRMLESGYLRTDSLNAKGRECLDLWLAASEFAADVAITGRYKAWDKHDFFGFRGYDAIHGSKAVGNIDLIQATMHEASGSFHNSGMCDDPGRAMAIDAFAIMLDAQARQRDSSLQYLKDVHTAGISRDVGFMQKYIRLLRTSLSLLSRARGFLEDVAY